MRHYAPKASRTTTGRRNLLSGRWVVAIAVTAAAGANQPRRINQWKLSRIMRYSRITAARLITAFAVRSDPKPPLFISVQSFQPLRSALFGCTSLRSHAALRYSPRDMPVLPVALARDTIVECVFEMRFIDPHPGVANLLPGIVFGSHPGRFKNVAALPLSHIPKVARDQNPLLRYMPTTALEGPQARMMFSEYGVAVSFLKPYAGWVKVKPLIVECMNTALGSKLTGRPERYGLKYVNLLKEGRDAFDLDQTRVRIEMGDFGLRPQGAAAIHAEIELHGCTNIVDIATGGKITIPGQPREEVGVVISVDTVRNSATLDASAELPKVLELLHETEKEIYFGLLKGSTIEKLGPRYSTAH